MFTHTDLRDSSFFCWDGIPLEELSHPSKYVATVAWPNGEIELLDLIIMTRYEGYDDDRHQECFLLVNHNGFSGFLEISDRSEDSFKMIINLEMINYT